jgi:shikimate kinase
VIYLNKELQKKLRKYSKIVYLDTTKSKLDDMFETFCKFPKPIIWGGKYKALKNENENDTLKRCYKNLLDFRIARYKKLAHTILPYNYQRKPGRTIKEILNKIK